VTAPPPLPDLTPGDVDQEAQRLMALSHDDFGNELLENVMDPSPLQVAAFRHESVVARTVQIAGKLLQHRSLTFRPDSGETGAEFHQDIRARRKALTEEYRVCQLVLMGDDARHGWVPMATLSDDEFAAALIAHVIDRDPSRTARFRHPSVVRRTAKTADRLLRDHGTIVQQRDGEPRNAFARRARHVRQAMQLELRLAQLAVQGDDARVDRTPYDPSPRARAARRLVADQPVRYLEFLRQEQDKDADARRRAKAGRRRRSER
jgi:hypothetical protein